MKLLGGRLQSLLCFLMMMSGVYFLFQGVADVRAKQIEDLGPYHAHGALCDFATHVTIHYYSVRAHCLFLWSGAKLTRC